MANRGQQSDGRFSRRYNHRNYPCSISHLEQKRWDSHQDADFGFGSGFEIIALISMNKPYPKVFHFINV